MKKGTHVRISKNWHKPEITLEVTDTELEISMPLSDFIKALAVEVGRPIGILTTTQLLEKLEAAAAAVTLSMKWETKPIAG